MIDPGPPPPPPFDARSPLPVVSAVVDHDARVGIPSVVVVVVARALHLPSGSSVFVVQLRARTVHAPLAAVLTPTDVATRAHIEPDGDDKEADTAAASLARVVVAIAIAIAIAAAGCETTTTTETRDRSSSIPSCIQK
jgi:hypothetical protein